MPLPDNNSGVRASDAVFGWFSMDDDVCASLEAFGMGVASCGTATEPTGVLVMPCAGDGWPVLN